MSLQVADLYGILRLEKSQWNQGMASAEGDAKRSHSWLGAIATGAKVVVGGLAAAGIAAGTMGFKTAAGTQTATIAFTTMLGSGEKAKAFLEDLAGFAAKTPFEFPELQTAASSLISAGFEASKVIPIMTTLGNVTSGMGTGAEGVKRATVALQQMSAAGKITGEDLNQLRDAGVPVFELLAAATGKSKEEIAKLAQAGKLGKEEMEQLFAALESGKGLERFAGLMEAQSLSFTGAMSSWRDALSQGLGKAMMPVVELAAELLPGATAKTTAALDLLVPKVAAVVAWFREATAAGGVLRDRYYDVTGAVQAVVGWFRSATDQGSSLNQAWADVRAGLDPLIDRLGSTVTTGDGVSGMWDRISAAIAAIDWSDVGAQISEIGESAGDLVPAVQAFIDQMPSLSDVVSVGGAVLGFLADHVDTLIKYMPLLVAAVVAFKVAQAASNVVALLTPGIRIAEIIVNRQLTASQRALTVAVRAQSVAARTGAASEVVATAAKNGGRLASLRAVVATVAHTAVEKTRAVVTKAGAAAQWLLNAAMAANPIMLVVIAITALVAGLVYAYQHSETFRRIVDAAFRAVGAAATWLWENVMRPVVDGIVAGFEWLVSAGQTMLAGIVAVFTAVGTAVSTAKQWAIDRLVELITWVTGLPARLAAAVIALWDWIWARAGAIKDAVIGAFVAFGEWVAGLPAWALEKGGAIWDWITTKAGEIKGHVVTAMSNLWTWISEELPGILGSAGSRVWEWIVATARQAAVDAWNAIVGVLGGSRPQIPLPPGDTGLPGAAKGGVFEQASLTWIGEGREREWALPDSKLAAFADRIIAGTRGGDGASAPTVHLQIVRQGPVAMPEDEMYQLAYEGTTKALWFGQQ